ncbi:hypothetical protein GUJ93_ZPchr0006g43801 [Zizania palustris]|uniref:Uncharacterized protein n=1 Tax=Zizania palustris TaxID=103762 RepID=A0A8J5W4A0_ZIZPA|nr:hypothetical protein GUJ93_ZPchr0006g43801 [Zizania palustris]
MRPLRLSPRATAGAGARYDPRSSAHLAGRDLPRRLLASEEKAAPPAQARPNNGGAGQQHSPRSQIRSNSAQLKSPYESSPPTSSLMEEPKFH